MRSGVLSKKNQKRERGDSPFSKCSTRQKLRTRIFNYEERHASSRGKTVQRIRKLPRNQSWRENESEGLSERFFHRKERLDPREFHQLVPPGNRISKRCGGAATRNFPSKRGPEKVSGRKRLQGEEEQGGRSLKRGVSSRERRKKTPVAEGVDGEGNITHLQ